MRRIVYDVEADNLLNDVSVIHCMSTWDIDSNTRKHFTNIEEALRYLDTADVIIGHNVSIYDNPALLKLYGWIPKATVFDTLLAWNILYPEEKKPSLETVAFKLGLKVQKVAHSDWSVWSPAMKVRCDTDVTINKAIFDYILGNKHFDMIGDALQLEQEVGTLHAQQTLQGVVVDTDKVWMLIDGLDKKLDRLRDEILLDAPWQCRIRGVGVGKQEEEKEARYTALVTKGEAKCSQAFRKDKRYTADTMKYFGTDYLKVKGAYTKIDLLPLNLNSSDEVKKLLLDLGWVPTEWNFNKDSDPWVKTSPKLTEDSYWSLPQGLGLKVARYNTIKHRRSFLLSMKGDSGVIRKIRKDGRVSADAFTCGTPTARYRHSGAICNIPRITSPYGRAFRGIFGVAKGHWQIGIDLSGIEARMLAHWILLLDLPDARKTADLIISPDKGNDFHSYNAKVWKCDRNTAKTVLYALLFGAGAAKLARTLGIPESEGKHIKDNFYEAHPAIKKLCDMLEQAHKRNGGYVKGLDGRPLYIRKTSALLNTLLQSSAAILFKRWMVTCNKLAPSTARQFIAMHDEHQWECSGTKEEAVVWAERMAELSLETGIAMDIKVPISSEWKVGTNWFHTH